MSCDVSTVWVLFVFFTIRLCWYKNDSFSIHQNGCCLKGAPCSSQAPVFSSSPFQLLQVPGRTHPASWARSRNTEQTWGIPCPLGAALWKYEHQFKLTWNHYVTDEPYNISEVLASLFSLICWHSLTEILLDYQLPLLCSHIHPPSIVAGTECLIDD